MATRARRVRAVPPLVGVGVWGWGVGCGVGVGVGLGDRARVKGWVERGWRPHRQARRPPRRRLRRAA